MSFIVRGEELNLKQVEMWLKIFDSARNSKEATLVTCIHQCLNVCVQVPF